MLHLVLLIACTLAIEIFIRSGLTSHLISIVSLSKKVATIIPNKFVSDHWKEQAVPLYALGIMKYSLKIFFILLSIIMIFIVLDFVVSDLLLYTLSIIGIIESLIFAYAYTYVRKHIF